ncbi:hypothetical protein D3C72_1991290 [compost metagenome]
MALLRLAGGGDMGLFAEEAAGRRLGPHPVIKGGQGQGRLAAQQRPHGAIAAGGLSQAHEAHAVADVFARHDVVSLPTPAQGSAPAYPFEP